MRLIININDPCTTLVQVSADNTHPVFSDIRCVVVVAIVACLSIFESTGNYSCA